MKHEDFLTLNNRKYVYSGSGNWYFNINGYAYNSLSKYVHDLTNPDTNLNINGYNLLIGYIKTFNIQPLNNLYNTKRNPEEYRKGQLKLGARIYPAMFNRNIFNLTKFDRLENLKFLTNQINLNNYRIENKLYNESLINLELPSDYPKYDIFDVHRLALQGLKEGKISQELFNSVDFLTEDETQLSIYLPSHHIHTFKGEIKLMNSTNNKTLYILTTKDNNITFSTYDKAKAYRLIKTPRFEGGTLKTNLDNNLADYPTLKVKNKD